VIGSHAASDHLSPPLEAGANTRVLVSAALGSALTPLNSTMVAVALPALSRDFAAPASRVTLTVITGYLIATLLAQLPAGRVADRVGYVRALAWGRWLFVAGSIVGTFAPSLWVVVAGRLLMAVGGAFIIPTAMALVRVAVPASRRSRAFGTLGAVLGGAAAIGPAVGAAMVAQFGWRSLFVINVPILLASAALQPRIERSGSVRDQRRLQLRVAANARLSCRVGRDRHSEPGDVFAADPRAVHVRIAAAAIRASVRDHRHDCDDGARLAVGGWLVESIGARAVVIAGGVDRHGRCRCRSRSCRRTPSRRRSVASCCWSVSDWDCRPVRLRQWR
jgi:MFS family permease